jgi:hypothetical protein
MHMNRQWKIAAGTGAAVLLTGLGASAVAAGGGIDLFDRSDPSPIEVDLTGDGSSSDPTGSAAGSPFDSTDSPSDSPSDSPTDSPTDSPSDSPAGGDPPDASADSPDRPDEGSADSADGSAD